MKSLQIYATALVLFIARNASALTTLEYAKTRPELSTFVQVVTDAGLAGDLQRLGKHTLLAPVNATFASLNSAAMESLLANKDCLRELLLTHILVGSLRTNGGDVVPAPFIFIATDTDTNVPFRPSYFKTMGKTELKGFYYTSPRPGEVIYGFTNYSGAPTDGSASINMDGTANSTRVLSNGSLQPVNGLLLNCSPRRN